MGDVSFIFSIVRLGQLMPTIDPAALITKSSSLDGVLRAYQPVRSSVFVISDSDSDSDSGSDSDSDSDTNVGLRPFLCTPFGHSGFTSVSRLVNAVIICLYYFVVFTL